RKSKGEQRFPLGTPIEQVQYRPRAATLAGFTQYVRGSRRSRSLRTLGVVAAVGLRQAETAPGTIGRGGLQNKTDGGQHVPRGVEQADTVALEAAIVLLAQFAFRCRVENDRTPGRGSGKHGLPCLNHSNAAALVGIVCVVTE